MKTPSLFIGNWKMNGNSSDLQKIIDSIEKSVGDGASDVVICPPFPLLFQQNNRKKQSKVRIGAQDCHYAKSGAYTGDVSAEMVVESGCSHVIIGHSERRLYHHEDNATISKKVSAAIEAGLVPVLCVGETYNQREGNQVREVISSQVRSALEHNVKSKQIVIAYEPVWAIGTGKIPTVKEISEVCVIIKESLGYIGIDATRDKVHILYGGSVNDGNVEELNKVGSLSGFLVGAASLDSKKFSNIVNSRRN